MKTKLTKYFLLLFLPSAMISCGGGDKSNKSVDNKELEITDEASEILQKGKTKKDGPFDIKSGVVEYEDKNLDGQVKAILKLSFDNYGSVVKLEETAGGETSIYMYNDATKKGVTLFPGRKASKIFMRQGEINRFVALRSQSGYTKQEDVEILGKNCEVYANNAKSTAGESQLTYWIHQGIALKEINRLGLGYIFEAVSFDEKSIESTIFSLPGGVDLPHDIF